MALNLVLVRSHYITIFTFDFYFISALFPQHFDDSFSSRPVSRHFKAKLHIELNPKQLQLVLNLILKYVISCEIGCCLFWDACCHL